MRCFYSLFGRPDSLFGVADFAVPRAGKLALRPGKSLSGIEKADSRQSRTKKIPCRREFPADAGAAWCETGA